MLNGLNSLSLSLMSSNIRRVKKMSLLMHCFRRYTMLSQHDFKIFGLETIKAQYARDDDFKDVLLNCNKGKTWNKFVLAYGFVFRANKLCILDSTMRLF